MSFEVGDIVICELSPNLRKKATIIRLNYAESDVVCIEFFKEDDDGLGHSCRGLVPSGRGWYCDVASLKLARKAGPKQPYEDIIIKIKALDKKFKERKTHGTT